MPGLRDSQVSQTSQAYTLDNIQKYEKVLREMKYRYFHDKLVIEINRWADLCTSIKMQIL